jgi:hypothetical protein
MQGKKSVPTPLGAERSQPAHLPRSASPSWSAARFFSLLPTLGRLRIVSICGPSVFESLCEAGPFTIEHGSLNMMCDAYHWHVAIDRFRYLQSHDAMHGRSGRTVLYFELRERVDAVPFLRIYLHRAPGVGFDPELVARFAAIHAELANGVELGVGGETDSADRSAEGA